MRAATATLRSAVRRTAEPRRAGTLVLLVLALLVALMAPTAAGADDKAKKKAVDDKVDQVQDALNESSKAVAEAAKALEAAKVGLPRAQKELERARTDYRAAQQLEASVRAELQRAEERVEREQAKVDAVLAEMEQTRQTIGAIARTVYAQGPYAQLEVILESADPGDFAERLQSVRTVVKGQDKALGELGEQRADLQRRKEQLEAARAQVEKRRQEAEGRRQQAEAIAQQAEAVKKRIDALVRARANALRVADREKATTKRQLAALKKEQDRLATLLSSTGDARRYPSGALQWPAPGPVSQGVGPRVHPVYGYASCHTGIDISVGSGVPIRSAASGTVVDTRSGGPYGLHTIVDHGDGLATMYAHQSRFGVSPGQRVSKGEVIGYVGSTGYSTGPHLHFEVWVSGRPFDPMGWFGGERRAVVC